MPHVGRVRITLVVAVVAMIAMSGGSAFSQPNPYRLVENWPKLPEGRTLGSVSAVTVDRDGNIWAFERCGANSCAGSNLAPILKFDPSGKLLKSFGAGMFVFPHGIYADRDGNVWVTDSQGKDGKGHQVIKFSPDGKILMMLGEAGVAGDGPGTFNAPSAVVIASNGDIFVADGHGADTNARIVKFSKDGKFIKAWGKKGSAAGEFNGLHAIAMDSKDRVFVGDRSNSRIQVFDKDGKFLEEWRQFGRPSGITIDANDTIYVADSQSDEKVNPGVQQGIRIGSTKDGIVKFLIPVVGLETNALVGAEGAAADAMGNIYAGETGGMDLRKYVKK